MVSAVSGTVIAAELFEMGTLLISPAGAAIAMPPAINAVAGRAAQTVRQDSAIVRTSRWTPWFDMSFSLSETKLQMGLFV
jgi:hypothetical protein